MAVLSVPYEHSTIELVSAREEKLIVMGERQQSDFIVMFRHSEDGFLLVEGPQTDI